MQIKEREIALFDNIMLMEEKITTELKAAMLARDAQKTNVLRSMKSAIKSAEIDKRAKSPEPLSDQEKIDALTKQYKMRMESVLAYEQAGQADRAGDERAEAELIKQYLPESIEGEALERLIDEAISSLPVANMGAVIGKVKALSVGKMIDMGAASKIINQKLSNK